jgi:hypothetical protein
MSIAKLSKQQYFFRVLGYGVNAIAPTLIVIVATVTLFWNAVVASIVSTLLQSQSLQQTEQQALRESLLACKDTFEEVGAKLRIQLGLQQTHI